MADTTISVNFLKLIILIQAGPTKLSSEGEREAGFAIVPEIIDFK